MESELPGLLLKGKGGLLCFLLAGVWTIFDLVAEEQHPRNACSTRWKELGSLKPRKFCESPGLLSPRPLHVREVPTYLSHLRSFVTQLDFVPVIIGALSKCC